MSLQQIEERVSRLSDAELRAFSAWFEGFLADAWDDQIERDAANGGLDRLIAKLGIDPETDATEPMQAGFERFKVAGRVSE